MKVIELRRLARKLDNFSMSRNEIKFARKQELIEAITTYSKLEREDNEDNYD
jgi:hypothetical protein